MSDAPELTPHGRAAYPYEAYLSLPDGSLARGRFTFFDGESVRVVGRLRTGELLAMFADGGWIAVPEKLVRRIPGSRGA